MTTSCMTNTLRQLFRLFSPSRSWYLRSPINSSPMPNFQVAFCSRNHTRPRRSSSTCSVLLATQLGVNCSFTKDWNLRSFDCTKFGSRRTKWQFIHDACLQQRDIATDVKQASVFLPTKFELDVSFFREACYRLLESSRCDSSSIESQHSTS